MNDQTRSEVRHEVQDFLGSREMFDQPKGKVELTPVAQKAIDGYLYTWISRLGALIVIAVTLAGFLGYKDMSASSESVAKEFSDSAEKATEEAMFSFKRYQDVLKTSQEELGVFASETQIAIENARDEVSLKLQHDSERIDVLIEQLERQLDDLRSRSSAFSIDLDEKRDEWNTITVVEELQGLAERIAADDRILGFIADRMTLNALPVGSIVGWHKNVEGIVVGRLPKGWIECNGPILPGDQPDWAEGLDLSGVPNLNAVDGYAGGRFLRGGTSSGTPQKATALPVLSEYSEGAVFFGNRNITTTPFSDADEQIPSDPPGRRSIGISQNDAANPRTYAVRVRPVNMSVVWIMRVK